MARVIFLGPPGAGKGTQGQLIAERFGVPHISTGDILRNAIAQGTPLGLKAKTYVDKGDLVPDELILDLIKETLQREEAKQGWVLDGFPRNVAQAEFLTQLLALLQQPCHLVINLDVPDEVILQRLLARGRKDDTEDTIRHRLGVYREQTAPLIDYYKKMGLLKTVNGNRPPAEITDEIQSLIQASQS